MLRMSELLEYSLQAKVPDVFVDRLLDNRDHWDDEFRRQLVELAYEFRPDLAVWYLDTDEQGRLLQFRLAPSASSLKR